MDRRIEMLKNLIAETNESMEIIKAETKGMKMQNDASRIEKYHYFRNAMMELVGCMELRDKSIRIKIPKDICQMYDDEAYSVIIGNTSVGVITRNDSMGYMHGHEVCLNYLDKCENRMKSYFESSRFHKITTAPDYALESLISYITDKFIEAKTNIISEQLDAVNRAYESEKAEQEMRG